MRKEEAIFLTRREMEDIVRVLFKQNVDELRELVCPRYYTIDALCREFGVSPQTVRRWAIKGTLKPLRLGGKVVFSREDVENELRRKPVLSNAKRRKGGKR